MRFVDLTDLVLIYKILIKIFKTTIVTITLSFPLTMTHDRMKHFQLIESD